MQATSREAARVLRERFGELTATLDSESLRTLSEDLSSVVGLLSSQVALRRHLADPSASAAGRSGLARSVLSNRVGDTALTLVVEASAQRWSRPPDLLTSLELCGRQASLIVAERNGVADEVEDELFRFSRVLDSQARLRGLLTDTSTPARRRVELLDSLVAAKVNPVTLQLLRQAVAVPRGRSIEVVVSELAEIAASRRDRSVAAVTAAAPLSQDQEERLARVLSRIYRREVSVKVEIDPDIIGGLVVRLDDEVIDGSIAAKLARVNLGLPR